MPGTRNTSERTSHPYNEGTSSLISHDKLQRMYAALLGCRQLARRVEREGEQPAFSDSPVTQAVSFALGREAMVVGATLDLRKEDAIAAPTGEVIFRQNDAPAASKDKHYSKANSTSSRDVIAFTPGCGSQLTIATGIAMSNKDAASGHVVVAFGEALSSSLNAWSEALQFSGKYRLPVIFVLGTGGAGPEREDEVTSSTILQQAKLAQVTAIPVDATDTIAMYRVSFEAIARARKLTGATLIVGARYVVEGSDAVAEFADPLIRMEAYLRSRGLFSHSKKQALLKEFGLRSS